MKDSLYSLCCEDNESFYIIKALDNVIKKYNNHVHNIAKFPSTQIFFSNDENPFKKVLENIKKSFKNINIDNINLILMINEFWK